VILPLIAATATIAAPSATRLIHFEPNADFALGQEVVLTYPNVNPGVEFTEVIPSWNVAEAQNAAVSVELRARGEGWESKWYHLGNWSLTGPRASVNGQRDAHGNVLTDTLVLAKPAQTLDLRVTMRTLGPGPVPRLKLLTLNFATPGAYRPSGREKSPAWGKVIDVPQRAQGNYPRGSVLCSPTCVSMMLWHYANELSRPELDRDVPDVEQGVWDEVYKGAGNWPFNAAYLGSFPGLRSYITRLDGIEDLERWIEAGIPVIVSGSLNLFKGEERDQNGGHLVILVGFTEEGDGVFNDPARRDQVRLVYKRENIEKAWMNSKRTVYIVHPEGAAVPRESSGRWIE
jgi:hypothetical protein